MAQTGIISALHAIREKSMELKLLVGGPSIPRPLLTAATAFPSLSLRYPTDILRQVEELPLSQASLQHIKTKMHRLISSLQTTWVETYKQTCRRLALIPDGPSSMNNVREAFEASYHNRHLSALRSQVIQWRKMIESQRSAPRKVTFNAVCPTF